MSPLPLPPRYRGHLDLAGPSNRSLLFDRGLATYSDKPEWKLRGTAKQDFFASFVNRFNGDFRAGLERRRQALNTLGAESVALEAAARLVVGLGLPHPTETGFLFDRLSGCPYLPGSSVKGLLRASAKAVAAGDLPGDKRFWSANITRVFGPEPSSEGAQGRAVFYDSFPDQWPTLEVDILTPHHSDYYVANGSSPPPGDWEDPKPVPFLAVKAGTRFCFFFRSLEGAEQRGSDEDAIRALLPVALEWLGIGAKKSAGYGYFEGEHVQGPGAGTRNVPKEQRPTTWKGATLSWVPNTGTLKATQGHDNAETKDKAVLDKVPTALLAAIKKRRKVVTGDVIVLPEGGKNYRLLEVVGGEK